MRDQYAIIMNLDDPALMLNTLIQNTKDIYFSYLVHQNQRYTNFTEWNKGLIYERGLVKLSPPGPSL